MGEGRAGPELIHLVALGEAADDAHAVGAGVVLIPDQHPDHAALGDGRMLEFLWDTRPDEDQ